MRYKFIILFLLIGFVSKAQVYQLMPQYGYSTYRMNFDSTIQIPTFCGVPKLGSNKINKGALAFDSCNNRFYFFNPKSQAWDTIKSGSTIDTTKFVRYTDTSAMLLPYLKKQDTVSLSNRIEGRIDSLKLSNDSIYARKNSQFVFQYMNDTATVVKASVRNSESFTINRGQVVYIFGASGDKASVKLADNSGDITSARTLGFVREDIASGQTGWVTTQGQVEKLQLGAYNEGDILWLDSIPGGFTKTKPVAPRHSVFLGVVERANNGNGIAYVKPQNGYELGELHDVKITSPQTNEVLAYTTNIWENKNIYSIVDTTSLSNRINTKLNISDTSAMLSPYARTNSVNASLATKLNISDTSTMLSPYLRSNTANASFVTSVFRKTASDSVFFVRGGTNNFAFRDSAGGANIYNTDGSLTGARTLTLNSQPLTILGTTPNRFHANGNITFGQTESGGVSFSDSTFKLSVVSSNLNLLRLARNVAGGEAIRITYNTSAASTYLSSSNSSMNIASRDNLVIGGGTSQRLTLGCNLSDGLSPVAIGYESWRASSSSAILDIRSTNRGFLQPRMTNSEMNAISTPATGLSVFNTTDSSNYIYRGTGGGWQPLATGNNTFKLDVTGQGRATQGFQATGVVSSIPSNCTLMDYGTQGGRIAAVAAGGSTFQPLFINTGGADVKNNVYVGYSTTTSSGRGEFMQVNGSVLSQGGYVARSSGNYYPLTFINTTGASSGFFSPPSGYSNTSFPAIEANSIGLLSSIDGAANPIYFGASKLNFQIGTGTNSMKAQIAPTSGNLILQDGGTFTDVSSARLQVNSTSQGFLPPRMTTAQRDLISSPAAGLIIYNTSTNKHQGYNGTTWNDFY